MITFLQLLFSKWSINQFCYIFVKRGGVVFVYKLRTLSVVYK
jgi:hypothetical protein